MGRTRTRWLRRLRSIGLYLLLGLVTTIGVAWGLAAWLPMDKGAVAATVDTSHSPKVFDVLRVGRLGSMRRVWYAHVSGVDASMGSVLEFAFYPRDSADQPLGSWSAAGPDSWGQVSQGHENWNGDGGVGGGWEDGRGWPALACWCSAMDIVQYFKSPVQYPLKVRGGISLAPFGRPSRVPGFSDTPLKLRALPLLPIWPGLALDTVFYALLWWLGFASVRMVKHNRRYGRGLCPKCRYDLKADYSGGCPGCGWRRIDSTGRTRG